MSNTVKGAGRRKYAAQQAKHSQRSPLPPRGTNPAGDARAIVTAAVQEQRESNAKKRQPATPATTTKAGQFADKAEELGWVVERSRNDDGSKTVAAVRGEESIRITWTDREVFLDNATYMLSNSNGPLRKIRNAAEAYRMLSRSHEEALGAAAARKRPGKSVATTTGPRVPKRRVPFDPKTATPEEVLQAVAGHKIVWYNSMTESFEEGRVPAENRTKQRRGADGQLVDVPIRSQTAITPSQSEDSFGRLILAFCDPHLGYRACFVDAIQQVGGR